METIEMFEEKFNVEVERVNSREYKITAKNQKDEIKAVATEFIEFNIGFYTEDDSDGIYVTVNSFEKYLNRVV